MAQQAVDATPPENPHRAQWMNRLGVHLGQKYSRTGAMADIEQAIIVTQQAIDSTPSGHPDRSKQINNLAISFGDRYPRTGEMADLEEAINITRQAINATPTDHLDWPGHLSNLGVYLDQRYSQFSALADIREAIYVTRQPINATPINRPVRAQWLSNLGLFLGHRYSQTEALADLEEAINITREANNGAPSDHPEQARQFCNLGHCLCDRYSRTREIADLEEAKQCFTTALNQSTSIISKRVEAGHYFLSSPGILQDQQAYTIAKMTIDLIPLLMTRSLQNTDKRHLLSAAVGLSSDAAAIALHFDQGPGAAFKLLETGRGVIAVALHEKSGVHALERAHPEMARSFIKLRDQLDTPLSQTFLATAEQSTMAARKRGHQRQEAGLQLTHLLETIRSQPGFERFVLSISEADMLMAALFGPIVVLNVSSHRCDALIIIQSGIRLLEIPHISQETINDHVGNLQSLKTLEWLWDDIVHPVLDNVGFTGPPSGSQWPHIWWVPTGKLTRLPLHAAGYHLRRSGETALDRVISSYSSSVKAIIHSRQQGTEALAAGEVHNIVAVAMQHTPKQGSLGFAHGEINIVLATCGSMELRHNKTIPRKNDVLSAFGTCCIFHFAGHGGTHPTEPLHSQLLLEDWDQEPFTVASLLETNLASKPPFLAYLSACGTGQILDGTSVDESIHLASAFQLAGFRHVIGTLWSVDDRVSVDMARMTYEFLHNKGVRDESVSCGLHRATRMLRDQWVDSEVDIGQGNSRGTSSTRHGALVVLGQKQLHRALVAPTRPLIRRLLMLRSA